MKARELSSEPIGDTPVQLTFSKSMLGDLDSGTINSPGNTHREES